MESLNTLHFRHGPIPIPSRFKKHFVILLQEFFPSYFPTFTNRPITYKQGWQKSQRGFKIVQTFNLLKLLFLLLYLIHVIWFLE
jgi:hypothetical protein